MAAPERGNVWRARLPAKLHSLDIAVASGRRQSAARQAPWRIPCLGC